MKIKDDVNLDGVRPIMLRVLAICDEVHQQIFGEDVVVTEVVVDRTQVSLHPHGLASDLRARGHEEKMGHVYMNTVQNQCDLELGTNVVEMLRHGPVDHYHIEVDPKRIEG